MALEDLFQEPEYIRKWFLTLKIGIQFTQKLCQNYPYTFHYYDHAKIVFIAKTNSYS